VLTHRNIDIGTDHGWVAKADALHARLVPPGLDPDPLGTVERLVAEQKAAEESADLGRGGRQLPGLIGRTLGDVRRGRVGLA